MFSKVFARTITAEKVLGFGSREYEWIEVE
jgi:hypothetical protein